MMFVCRGCGRSVERPDGVVMNYRRRNFCTYGCGSRFLNGEYVRLREESRSGRFKG